MVSSDSDADEVIAGLEQDIGEHVRATAKSGENRIEVTGETRGTDIYPNAILEYFSILGWAPDRIRYNMNNEPVVDFVRDDEYGLLISRGRQKFDSIEFEEQFR
ncbi:hypothetical protein C475_22159 [Halosimplex carlsbadense 2-9-1]|uniref:Uncharacterized protein n=1 Tax=Halosimplex carlsbadense 2-9-1 TaxID=797114 RepID=M0C8Y4_9EURY|nr:hypothetical protein [Halosimplex carlsbadense]ELZ19695.1 hypothetical protein C475_22159 [Halosimplex carlsbadense 2-9-1]